jgi:hypothetical protein
VGEYTHDPRVVFNDDGTVTIPDHLGRADWTVRQRAAMWVVDNPELGLLRDMEHPDRVAQFAFRDEAIFALIGDPRTWV